MSRLHRVALEVLIGEIVDGEVAPGEMLPREVDLAERFGISRGVVRECVRGLEERGLVRVKHGRGATVNPPEEWNAVDPDVLRALLASREGDRLLAETLECQRTLEVEAAGLAAQRAKRVHLQELTRALRRTAAAAPRTRRSPAAWQRYHEADRDFHRAVVQASGNRALARMAEPLHRALAAAGTLESETALERRHAEHRRVLAAIAARDPEAARAAMAAHLEASSR
jgi:GntR family transcriptional repressor for pyruvate dehydrogenase complex